jgi:hypothetical protein
MLALLSSRLGMYGAIALAIAIAFGSLYGAYKIKAYQLEQARVALAQSEANNATLNATVGQQRQNRKAQQNSATIQQKVELQVAPVLQQIEDSTPVTYLNEKQLKIVADICRLHNCGGVFTVGPCGSTERTDLLPKADKAGVH